MVGILRRECKEREMYIIFCQTGKIQANLAESILHFQINTNHPEILLKYRYCISKAVVQNIA